MSSTPTASLQPPGIDFRQIQCSAAGMARSAAKVPAAVDHLQDDVMDACDRIHELAKSKGWDLKKLGKEAGHSFQSFVNWKKGHKLPKIEYLQDFAAAVRASVRVVVQDAQQQELGAPEMAPQAKRLLGIYRRLTASEQQALIDKALDLLSEGGGNFEVPDEDEGLTPARRS